MKFNLSKCVFAIRKERFLGFLVRNKGIKPILRRFKQYWTWLLLKKSKIFNASLGDEPPSTNSYQKQKNTTYHFFQILKNITNFKWTSECHKAFEVLKVYLFSSMILSQPRETESIFLYLRVFNQAINFILVK